jgi:hypothetical protein
VASFFSLPVFGEGQGGACFIKRRAVERSTPILPEDGEVN